MDGKIKILNKVQLQQKINRLAWQILERNYDKKEIIIAGIIKRGESFSKRIATTLESISEMDIKHASITLDKKNPFDKEVKCSLSQEECKNKVIILVDDVLNSGRTLMYAAKIFLDIPIQRLSTVVLVDRNHNNYPIKADYVGISLSTTLQDHVHVVFGKSEGVYLS